MNNILINQNKPENLKKLAAQRQLYREAKRVFGLQILFTVPITILLSLLRLIPSSDMPFNIATLIAIVSVLITVADIIVSQSIVTPFKNNAAKIQDQFDTEVYEMDSDILFTGKAVSPEIINRFSLRYVRDPKMPLEDWYPAEIKDYTKEQAIYTCQKTNLYYDSSLRTRFIRLTTIFSALTFLIILSTALAADASLNNFLLQVALPFTPVLYITLKIFFENNKSIRSANELHSVISALAGSKMPTMSELRTIQNKIFCARKEGALVPEFFYKKKRSGLEKEMHNNA